MVKHISREHKSLNPLSANENPLDTNLTLAGSPVNARFDSQPFELLDVTGEQAGTKKNHLPVAGNDTNGSDKVVEQGGSVKGDPKAAGNVLANDKDRDGDTLSVEDPGKMEGKFGTLKLGANGKWTYTLDNKDPDTDALKSGQTGVDTFKYTVTDGHHGEDTATLKVKINGTDDAAPLKITVDAITADNIVNHAEAVGSVNVTGTVTGQVKDGDAVTLLVNGTAFDGTVQSGHFSIAVTGTQLAFDHQVKATVTTGTSAHPVTATTTKAYAVDLDVPTATITVNSVAGDNVINAAEASGKVNITGTIGGDVQPGDTVTVLVDGHSHTGTVNNGKFSIAIDGSELVGATDKTIEVSVTTADLAGNTGTASDNIGYSVDTTVPQATIALSPVTQDNIVNATEASADIRIVGTVGGDVQNGDIVTLTVNGTHYTGEVDAHSFAIFVHSADVQADDDKTIHASVTTTDNAGNATTVTADQDYTVDTIAPAGTLKLDKVSGGFINAAEASGNIALSGTVTGEVHDGDVVTIVINDNEHQATVQSGAFSVSVAASELIADPDGVIEASVTLVDTAQNSATLNAATSYVVDTTPPNATITINAIGADDILDRSELDAGVTISGSVEGDVKDGDTVTISLGDHDYSAIVHAGAFSAVVSAADLAYNSHSDADLARLVDVSITVSDTAGNSVTAADERSYDLDIKYDLGDFSLDGDGFFVASSFDMIGLAGTAAFVGDVNGDGYDDFMSEYHNSTAVVAGGFFGSAAPTNIDVTAFSGFGITGLTAGFSISSAGDINGDGLDDIVIGAPQERNTYVFFGSTSIHSVDVSTLTPSTGFKISYGLDGQAGYSVSSAGDVNGDGIDDLIVGVPNPTSMTHEGRAYVIFGRADIGSANLDLTSLTASQGFKIAGPSRSLAGLGVSSAGDVNGDGIDDLIVGAPGDGSASGNTYVIYGTAQPGNIDLANLSATQGFAVHGAGSRAGASATGVGDVDGDGYDDFVIGAPLNGDGAFVLISGGPNLADLDLQNSADLAKTFYLFGDGDGGEFGTDISGFGDINGDGYSDFVVSAPVDPRGGTDAGSVSIYYGGANGPLPGPVVLGGAGFKLGYTVSSVGDVNGDGYADIIMGMHSANNATSGTAVIFGGLYKGGTPSEVLTGTTSAETLIGDAGNDTIVGSGGADILGGGAGNDVIAIGDMSFVKVAGGTGADTLRLAGSGMVVTSSSVTNHAITSIENIDLTGTGDNTLSIDRLAVQDISEERAAGKAILTVTGNAGDIVNVTDDGWTATRTEVINGVTFRVFDNGNAELLVQAGISVAVPSQVIDLAHLAPAEGISIPGLSGYRAGYSVASAGDINGDGYDDMLTGMVGADAAVALLGSANPVSVTSFSQVVAFQGAGATATGTSVSSAGDVNGDGIDDAIIGSPVASGANGNSAYVVFGTTSPGNVNLLSMTALQGFRISGEVSGDLAGASVSSAGDINGDGYSDLLVGAAQNGAGNGAAYVVFGGSALADTNLATMSSTQGFSIRGSTGENAGISVHSAGDVNGDGLGDLIVGASSNDGAGTDAGASYVIFGSSTSSSITLATLTTAQGYQLTGAAGAHLGTSVSAAGDVNGDGIGDLVVGDTSGAAYVVFGSAGAVHNIDVTSLAGGQGFAIAGLAGSSGLGESVASAGDVNGDGYDDIIVGASATSHGNAYVLFGGKSLSNIDLSHLTTDQGLVIQGAAAGDQAGYSVAAAGDVNQDGYDDVIVGAPSNADLGAQAGKAYVLFGGAFGLGNQPITTTGANTAETLIGGVGNDILTGGGGADVIRGGNGNDTIGVTGSNFRSIDGGGGYDTLRIDGATDSFDFTAIATSRIASIEAIDLSGTGNQSVTVTRLDVFHLSDDRTSGVTTLTMHGTAGDTVALSDQTWVNDGIVVSGSDTFNIFVNGNARLAIDSHMTVLF